MAKIMNPVTQMVLMTLLVACQPTDGSQTLQQIEVSTPVTTSTGMEVLPAGEISFPALRQVQDRTLLPAHGTVVFKVIHWNDFHGALLERTTTEGMWIPGIARLASFVKAESSVLGPDHTLVLDAGDWSPVGNPKIIDIQMNLFKGMGLDAMTVGNHDLWRGLPALVDFALDARPVEVLSQNMMGRDAGECMKSPVINGYQIYEITGDEDAVVRVAVVGLGMEALERSNVQSAYKTICYTDPVAAYETLYPSLVEREKADVVIVVSHSWLDLEKDFARQTNALGIAPDLIISGHSHTLMNTPEVIGKTRIAEVGDFGRAIGIFDLVYHRDSATLDTTWRQVVLNPCSPVDADTQAGLLQAFPDNMVIEEQPCISNQVPSNVVYLTALKPLKVRVGYWSLGVGTFPATEGGMVQGERIISHGIFFPNGLFAHAPSELVYDLDGAYTQFHAVINLKEMPCGNGAQFAIALDGREVFRSDVLRPESEPVEVSLDVSGTKRLILRTDDLGSNECDTTIWGDPYIE